MAAEVANVAFPQLLDPIDDIPPATIIAAVSRRDDQLIVTGISHDNGDVATVTVNEREAEITTATLGVTDWQVEIPVPADGTIAAAATAACTTSDEKSGAGMGAESCSPDHGKPLENSQRGCAINGMPVA